MRAVVAGAGYAGLTAALTLARQGWTVEVAERAADVRSEGYSIAFHENGLRVLEALGLLERALDQAIPLPARQIRDRHGRVLAEIDADYRTCRISRPHLVGVLAEAAAEAGVRVRFGTEVAGARPEGVLLLAGGDALEGDVVIAADGVNSRIPKTLGLVRRRAVSDEGALRVVMPRTPGEAGPGDDGRTGLEFWSGRRRFLYRAASATTAYCTFTAPARDRAARGIPIDPAVWGPAFPAVRDLIGKVAAEGDWDGPRWVPYTTVTLRAWSRGRVAVVGDAAHAMRPNLGQGGNCAIMNAWALGRVLGAGGSVEAALAAWERAERPVIDHAQRWSERFTWPLGWHEAVTSRALPALARTRWMRAQMTRPARHVPRVP